MALADQVRGGSLSCFKFLNNVEIVPKIVHLYESFYVRGVRETCHYTTVVYLRLLVCYKHKQTFQAFVLTLNYISSTNLNVCLQMGIRGVKGSVTGEGMIACTLQLVGVTRRHFIM